MTQPETTAPHRVALAQGFSEADACTYVIRRMGLIGYDTPLKRADCIGMVALGYPLVGHVYLYRPTVTDAMLHPLFYPAPKGARRGETLPLTADLSAPSPRTESGEPEWIHSNFQVLLVEDNPTPGDCAILWYGTL